MPGGADRGIMLSPPGTIGLPAAGAVVLLRFDEATADQRPRDAAGALADMTAGAPLQAMAMPELVDGVTGRARQFAGTTGGGAALVGLSAYDRESGASLVTRDLTLQAIASWDMDEQYARSGTGAIVRRGAAYALRLHVEDLATRTGSFNAGPSFVMPAGFTLITMTRRWVSPTLVVHRFYIGDLFVGETSGTSLISGATIDPFFVGFGTPDGFDPFMGVIDEVLVLDREISHEEIEATWLRITRYQPLGYQLLKELHDPGFPMSTDPGSDVQLETRMWGVALGYAAAQAENVRANLLPSRAYGSVLDDWETAVHSSPKPEYDLETRRARVLALLRQRRGSSIPGLQDSLEGLVGIDPALLQFLAFDNTIRDGFDGETGTDLEPERWDCQPTGSSNWQYLDGVCRCSPHTIGADYTFTGAIREWTTAETAVGGDGREAHALVKVTITTPVNGAEFGVYFGNRALGNYLLLGVRDVAGVHTFVLESFVAWVSVAPVTEMGSIGVGATAWLHLYQTATPGTWEARTAVIEGEWSAPQVVTHPALANLAGLYLRSLGPIAIPVATFDDYALRMPYGDRPFNAYVFRDSALDGTPADRMGANTVINAIKHAYIEGALITSKSVICDDDGSLCDHGPMGGF